MSIEEIFQKLQAKFGSERVLSLHTQTAAQTPTKDPWIEIAAPAIADVCEFLKSEPEFGFDGLNDLTAVDWLETDAKKKTQHEPRVEVVYHLYSYSKKRWLKLKVRLPRWKDGVKDQLPEIPSVSGVWHIADWHEREAYDLMGIQFTGHPNLRRILCPEDWEGHPLRKDYDFPLEYHGIRGQ